MTRTQLDRPQEDTAISLYGFPPDVAAAIREALDRHHARLAQTDRPTRQRTLTARNYGSSILALFGYLAALGERLPTKGNLEHWRDAMLDGLELSARGTPYAVKTINARLSAARSLLNAVADDITDPAAKNALRDWATVTDAKPITKQDRTEADYGRRFNLEAFAVLINSPDVSTLKGLRDRALLAVMGGAGLRVAEAVRLTLRDVFLTTNEDGQRGINVRRGKHGKQRVVVLNGWNSWVLRAVKAYTDRLDLDPMTTPDAFVFRGVQPARRGPHHEAAAYRSTDKPLSSRSAERAANAYTADYDGRRVTVTCHDLRRTYAKICKQAGMSWEALRANMGHSSVTITEDYVGREVDWSERVPNWTVELRD